MTVRLFYSIMLFFAGNHVLRCQQIIPILDSSFEKTIAWSSCNFADKTPVDIQPGAFGVIKPAADGNKYISMVTRQDSTYEGISQKLKYPLIENTCYTFSLMATRDSHYVSNIIDRGNTPFSFDRPVMLVLFGSDNPCGFGELLTHTPVINIYHWIKYSLSFQSNHTWKYLNIYAMPAGNKPYNGHALLDHIGALIPHPCSDDFRPDSSNVTRTKNTLISSPISSSGGIDHFDRLALTKSEYPSFFALSLFSRFGKIKATGHQTNTILDEYCKSLTDLSYTFYIKSENFKASKKSLSEYLKKWCSSLALRSRIKRFSNLQYDSPKWNNKDVDVVLMIE